jgi:hypothetical protein
MTALRTRHCVFSPPLYGTSRQIFVISEHHPKPGHLLVQEHQRIEGLVLRTCRHSAGNGQVGQEETAKKLVRSLTDR